MSKLNSSPASDHLKLILNAEELIFHRGDEVASQTLDSCGTVNSVVIVRDHSKTLDYLVTAEYFYL